MCKLASTSVKMAQKKKKTVGEKDRSFVAISTDVHKSLKDYTERNGYNMGGFTEKAIMEKIEKEKK